MQYSNSGQGWPCFWNWQPTQFMLCDRQRSPPFCALVQSKELHSHSTPFIQIASATACQSIFCKFYWRFFLPSIVKDWGEKFRQKYIQVFFWAIEIPHHMMLNQHVRQCLSTLFQKTVFPFIQSCILIEIEFLADFFC